jgi:prevent-host-death family protein
MKTIGIRELRQQASRHLRAVQAGETIQVTDRGKPVAMIVPVKPQEDVLEQLEAAGRLTRARGDLLKLGPPLKPKKGVPLPSKILEQMRADER